MLSFIFNSFLLIIFLLSIIILPIACILFYFYLRTVKEHKNITIAMTKESYDFISENLVKTSLKIDEIDHISKTLRSPLANDVLKEQWEECREYFIKNNEEFSKIEFSEKPSKKVFYENYNILTSMNKAIILVNYAENNLNNIKDFEQNKNDVRKHELDKQVDSFVSLHNTIRSIKPENSQTEMLIKKTNLLIKNARKLQNNTDNKDFLRYFLTIISKYVEIVDEVRELDSNISYVDGENRNATTVFEEDYFIGSSVNEDFISVSRMLNWFFDDFFNERNSER